jgi:hypothetical protein
MRDDPVRRAIKRVARLHFALSLVPTRAWRRLRGERSYRLAGTCRCSGDCCERPSLRVPAVVWYLPTPRRLVLWWQRVVNGFELVQEDRQAHVLVFRCTHFDAVTRLCDSYDSRPGICRDYPRVLLAQPNPQLFARCGYRVVAPNAEGLRRALAAQALTAEQRERLERELRLR